MGYDAWLLEQADKYCTGCEPKVVSCNKEFERFDENGEIETSTDEIYNCSQCDCTECEHWAEHN